MAQGITSLFKIQTMGRYQSGQLGRTVNGSSWGKPYDELSGITVKAKLIIQYANTVGTPFIN